MAPRRGDPHTPTPSGRPSGGFADPPIEERRGEERGYRG